jgi:hypothetical protein
MEQAHSFIAHFLTEPGVVAAALLFILIAFIVWRVPTLIKAKSEAEMTRFLSLRGELDTARAEVKTLTEKNHLLQEFIVKTNFLSDMRDDNRLRIDKGTRELETVIAKLKNFDDENPTVGDGKASSTKKQLQDERDRLVREVRQAYVERSTLFSHAEEKLRRQRESILREGEA